VVVGDWVLPGRCFGVIELEYQPARNVGGLEGGLTSAMNADDRADAGGTTPFQHSRGF